MRPSGHDMRKPIGYPSISAPQLRLMRSRNSGVWDAEASEVTEASEATEYNAGVPSTTPPSYCAALRDRPLYKPQSSTLFHLHPKAIEQSVSPPDAISSTAARKFIPRARERKRSPIREDDAWNKIKMIRDEKDADRFRDDKLLEGCWKVWIQGFQWIIVRTILLYRVSTFTDCFSDHE
jgi:protein SFI1